MNEYTGFGYYYDLYYSQITSDHSFYQELVAGAGTNPNILELASGSGRLMLPLLQAGYRVTGLDISDEMLGRAQEKLKTLPLHVQSHARLIKGDMRYPQEVLESEKFEVVILGFNSFQHLHTQEDQLACLERAHSALTPQGFFIISMDNATPDDPPADKLTELYGIMHDVERLSTVTLLVSTTDFPHHQRSNRRYMFYEKLPGGSNELICDVTLKLRYFYVAELTELVEKAGFRIESRYGSYNFEEYGPDSPRLIFVCRRARED